MASKSGKTPTYRQKASKKYEQNTVDRIAIRVAKGNVELLKNYVEAKKQKDPENPMFQSMNVFIIAVLEKETGLELKGILQEVQEYEKEKEIIKKRLDSLRSKIEQDDNYILPNIIRMQCDEWMREVGSFNVSTAQTKTIQNRSEKWKAEQIQMVKQWLKDDMVKLPAGKDVNDILENIWKIYEKEL